MIKTFNILAATAAAVVSLPAAAQVMTPAEYVATAGASDLYEITASKVVLETTQDPKIRQFAQMMIDQHSKSTAEVKAAAAKSRVRVSAPKLTPLQQELVTELRGEQGTARDAAYIAQQRASHGQALNVQKAYSLDGTAPALKTAAGNIVPVVQQHIAMLGTM